MTTGVAASSSFKPRGLAADANALSDGWYWYNSATLNAMSESLWSDNPSFEDGLIEQLTISGSLTGMPGTDMRIQRAYSGTNQYAGYRRGNKVAGVWQWGPWHAGEETAQGVWQTLTLQAPFMPTVSRYRDVGGRVDIQIQAQNTGAPVAGGQILFNFPITGYYTARRDFIRAHTSGVYNNTTPGQNYMYPAGLWFFNTSTVYANLDTRSLNGDTLIVDGSYYP